MRTHRAGVPDRFTRVPPPFSVVWTLLVGYFYLLRRTLYVFRWREIVYLVRYALRVVKFAGVGISVFIIGAGLLYFLRNVLGWPNFWSYLLEGAVSVELNFLGSRYITWSDRRAVGFRRSWLYFHYARLFTFGLNQILYNLQTNGLWVSGYGIPGLGLPAWLAYVAGAIVGAAFNYTANDTYTFAPGEQPDPADHGTIVTRYPKVSIVVPCKNNGDSIGRLLGALNRQTYVRSYPRNVQLVLVGDPYDQTWSGIGQFMAGAAINNVEVKVVSPGRDANAKRQQGMLYVSQDSEIIVYADADLMPGKYWLANIVDLLTTGGEKFVAGPVTGVAHSFWGRFIDRTTSGSKTPRVVRPFRLTADNIGEFKPPVTANLAVRREVWNAIHEPRPDFTNSYEDYEYAWRALRAGFTIYTTPLLSARRSHREGFRALLREYMRSGRGCGDFIVAYPYSPFSVFRLAQLIAIPIGVAAAVLGVMYQPVVALDLMAAATLSLILTNVLSAQHVEGVLYPFIGAVFSSTFVYGNCQRFTRRGFAPPVMPRVGRVRSRLIVNNRPSEWREDAR